MPYNKILIALDSSEYSMAAAKKGLELAHQLNAQAALIYVIDSSKAMGSVDANGRSGLAHLLVGSVAEHLIRHSKTPFMIVPSK